MTNLDNGENHCRLKGVPNKALKENPKQLYEKLYKGEKITFDLCNYKPMFKKEKGFIIKSLDKFERQVKI